MRFMLDTNIISDVIRNPAGKAAHAVAREGDGAVQPDAANTPRHASSILRLLQRRVLNRWSELDLMPSATKSAQASCNRDRFFELLNLGTQRARDPVT